MKFTFPLKLGGKRVTQIKIEIEYDEVGLEEPVEVSLFTNGGLTRMENWPLDLVFREMAQSADIELLLEHLLKARQPDPTQPGLRTKLKQSVAHELGHWMGKKPSVFD